MIELSFSRNHEPKTLVIYAPPNGWDQTASYRVTPAEFVDGTSPTELIDVYRFTSRGDRILFAQNTCDPFGNKWCTHQKVTAHLSMGDQTSVGATGLYQTASLASSFPLPVVDFGSVAAPSSWGDYGTPSVNSRSVSVIGGETMVRPIVTRCDHAGVQQFQGVTGLNTPSIYWNIVTDALRQRTYIIDVWAQFATRWMPDTFNGPVIIFSMYARFMKPVQAGMPPRWVNCQASIRVWSDRSAYPDHHDYYAWNPENGLWTSWAYNNIQAKGAYIGAGVSTTAVQWFCSKFPTFSNLGTPNDCIQAMEIFMRKRVKQLLGPAYSSITSTMFQRNDGVQHVQVGANGPSYEQRQAARDEAIHVLGSFAVAAGTYVDKGLTTQHEWNSLGNAAVDNIAEFSSNMLAYAADIKKVGDSIKSLIEVAGNPTDPKSWASLWLSARYGDRLTVRDTRELMKAISEMSKQLANANFFQTSHSMELNPIENVPRSIWTSGIRYNWYKVYYWPKDFTGLMKKVRELMEWDAWPTLENAWDMIPLSFVVDWFLSVSELLASIDRCVYKLYISVVSVLKTEKDVFACDVDFINEHLKLSVATQASCSVYLRRHASYLDYEPLVWSVGSLSTVNIVDGASLLIQSG